MNRRLRNYLLAISMGKLLRCYKLWSISLNSLVKRFRTMINLMCERTNERTTSGRRCSGRVRENRHKKRQKNDEFRRELAKQNTLSKWFMNIFEPLNVVRRREKKPSENLMVAESTWQNNCKWAREKIALCSFFTILWHSTFAVIWVNFISHKMSPRWS